MNELELDDPLEELRAAILDGEVERASALCQTDPGLIDERCHEDGRTALELALEEGRLAVAARLLELGADPCAPSADDHSALRSALSLPAADAAAWVERLLASGARPDGPALQTAASTGSMPLLERLLACDPSAHGHVGPLYGSLAAAALHAGDRATFALALDRLPRPIEVHALQWAYEAAAATGDTEAWERLRALGPADPRRALRAAMLAAVEHPSDAVWAQLKRIAADGGPGLASELFLFAATAGARAPDACEQLISIGLELGADINARDASGSTPLLLAADRHDVARLRRFAELGAAVDATDREGRNLRGYVERWPESVRLGELRLLLDELGAPPASAPRAPAPTRPDSGCLIVSVGMGIGVLIVLVVLLLHTCGLL